jgi:hypothetical protein
MIMALAAEKLKSGGAGTDTLGALTATGGDTETDAMAGEGGWKE